MDLGSSGPDLERCSNCNALFNHCKVKISTFIDAKTARVMFPRLLPGDFLCMECIKMVKSKTNMDSSHKRTLDGTGYSSVDSTPPPPKRDKKKGAVGGGGVPALPPPAPTSTQNT